MFNYWMDSGLTKGFQPWPNKALVSYYQIQALVSWLAGRAQRSATLTNPKSHSEADTHPEVSAHQTLMSWTDLVSFPHLHAHGWGVRILLLHFGVRRVEGSLVHELVVQIQGFQNFHIQLWQLRVLPGTKRKKTFKSTVQTPRTTHSRLCWNILGLC